MLHGMLSPRGGEELVELLIHNAELVIQPGLEVRQGAADLQLEHVLHVVAELTDAGFEPRLEPAYMAEHFSQALLHLPVVVAQSRHCRLNLMQVTKVFVRDFGCHTLV